MINILNIFKKKSRLETTGAGSGVEIIENRPYESKNEKGQYTLKVYHVSNYVFFLLNKKKKIINTKKNNNNKNN